MCGLVSQTSTSKHRFFFRDQVPITFGAVIGIWFPLLPNLESDPSMCNVAEHVSGGPALQLR